MTRTHPVLKGKTIFLRPLALSDVNATYLSWLMDDEVMDGLATHSYTIEKLYQYVQSRINDVDVAFYAICDAVSLEHIGNVKIDFHDSRANVSELGLMIGNKNYWGKGIGFEACHLLLKYGFDIMKLRKIYLAVYESNPNARRLYEKLGFKLEGTLRKHVYVRGEYQDKLLMGIFKEEFK
jgi:[ribosomal protein S5]-alanine N-acetyltransferase